MHDAVRKILTDVQWSLLPDYVQNPSANLTGPAPAAGGRGSNAGSARGSGRGGGGGL